MENKQIPQHQIKEKLFVSWSGGKDCMLALYRMKQKNMPVTHLINMCDIAVGKSRSHGISRLLIAAQAKAMEMEILQPESDFNNYEKVFKSTILDLKEKGITGGIFGDIYLQVHRDWIERVCDETGITPYFPLWKNNTESLLREFVANGFRTLVVSVNKDSLPSTWLGKEINEDFISDILNLDGIDPCAENGEYHSFVFDGPIFKHPVSFHQKESYFFENHWFLNLQ